LTSPLTTYGLGAINISTPVAGAVVLDLKEFTVTGNGAIRRAGERRQRLKPVHLATAGIARH
jgi:hypothetical protein